MLNTDLIRLSSIVDSGSSSNPFGYDAALLVNANSQVNMPNVKFFGVTPTGLEELTGLNYDSGTPIVSAVDKNLEYICAAGSATIRTRMHRRVGDSFALEVANSSALNANPTNVQFNPQTNYLYVANQGVSAAARQFLVFERTGDTFTAITSPTISGSGGAITFSVSPDGELILLQTNASPFVQTIKQSGSTFTNLGAPTGNTVTTDPTIQSPAWSPNGTRVCAFSTNRVILYTRSGDTVQMMVNSSGIWAGLRSLAWIDNDTVITVHSSTPYVRLTSVVGDVFTRLTDPLQTASGGYNVSVLPSGRCYISLSNTVTVNNLLEYQITGTTLTLMNTYTVSDGIYSARATGLITWPPLT